MARKLAFRNLTIRVPERETGNCKTKRKGQDLASLKCGSMC